MRLFFMYYFLFYWESLFQDSWGNDNYCPDGVFLNGRTCFFLFCLVFFREPRTITVLHVHTCDGAVLLFSLLTGHILSNEMLNCFVLGAEAEVIHVSRIKLLYSILQPRWDCGCSSIFNKCLFPRRPCWALWVNSVQEGKACSPHSGAL